MNLQLQRLRKRAGFKTQGDFAKVINVPERRYASWERGEAMMSLEQAYNCAIALGCTLDEIAGIEPPKDAFRDPYERELLDCYRASTKQRKAALLMNARDAAGMSKNMPESDISAIDDMTA